MVHMAWIYTCMLVLTYMLVQASARDVGYEKAQETEVMAHGDSNSSSPSVSKSTEGTENNAVANGDQNMKTVAQTNNNNSFKSEPMSKEEQNAIITGLTTTLSPPVPEEKELRVDSTSKITNDNQELGKCSKGYFWSHTEFNCHLCGKCCGSSRPISECVSQGLHKDMSCKEDGDCLPEPTVPPEPSFWSTTYGIIIIVVIGVVGVGAIVGVSFGGKCIYSNLTLAHPKQESTNNTQDEESLLSQGTESNASTADTSTANVSDQNPEGIPKQETGIPKVYSDDSEELSRDRQSQ